MSQRWFILPIASLLFVCSAIAQDLSGAWELHLLTKGQRDADVRRIVLSKETQGYSGTVAGFRLGISFDGDRASATWKNASGQEVGAGQGRYTDGALTGEGTFLRRQVSWSLRRSKRQTLAPTVHDYSPDKYSISYSGDTAPVLTIFPGDIVRTKTLDAGGRDEAGKYVLTGGANPHTGPFRIEGALPGDTLVVHIRKLRLTSNLAIAGGEVVSRWVDPEYLRDVPKPTGRTRQFKLDRERHTGRLEKPSERLKDFSVPLKPALGGIGVAPAGKMSLPTVWPGAFGGNLDYNRLVEGVTLYLPVFRNGALLFLGDGHAGQGDGEINGGAIETTLEVEFSVDIREGESLGSPWMEDEEWVMLSGIANDLTGALQAANTAALRWLNANYALDSFDAGTVLGTCVRYDIAEVVDPLVHIVARLPKAMLAQIKPVPR